MYRGRREDVFEFVEHSAAQFHGSFFHVRRLRGVTTLEKFGMNFQ